VGGTSQACAAGGWSQCKGLGDPPPPPPIPTLEHTGRLLHPVSLPGPRQLPAAQLEVPWQHFVALLLTASVSIQRRPRCSIPPHPTASYCTACQLAGQ
jgi:hypothetical protein